MKFENCYRCGKYPTVNNFHETVGCCYVMNMKDWNEVNNILKESRDFYLNPKVGDRVKCCIDHFRKIIQFENVMEKMHVPRGIYIVTKKTGCRYKCEKFCSGNLLTLKPEYTVEPPKKQIYKDECFLHFGALVSLRRVNYETVLLDKKIFLI